MIHRIPRAHPAVLAAVVAIAAVAVYANAFANGFALDDVFIILNNPRVRDLTNLRDIWLTPYWPWSGRELGLYRPAIIFLYAVQWAIGGGAPWVFHAANIVLNAVATILVFVLLRRLAGDVPAFVGALVFAVHPVHTEVVANMVGQAEIVAALAVLGACLVHTGRPDGVGISWPRRLLLVPLFLLALSTKESTVVLPGLLVALDFVQRRVKLSPDGLARYADAMLMTLFLLAATLAAYLLVRFHVMSGSVMGVDAAPAMPYLREEYRILNALRAFPEFIRLLFFPQELAADYLPAVIMPVDDVRPMVILGALLLAGFTLLALATPWLPAVGFPAAWFMLTIITVSNLFFPIGVLVAERTLYLPSVALSAAIAFAWRAAAPAASPAMRRLAPAMLAVAVALMAVRTWVRNPDWYDTPAVYRALVRDHPHAYRAQWVQAMSLRLQGEIELADEHFKMAYRIYPRDSQFLADYANFLLAIGRPHDAVTMLEQSYSLHPNVQNTVITLAHAYLATGRNEDALRMVREAERLGVGRASTMALRAYAYHALGRTELALAAARVAVKGSRMTWRMWSYMARNLAIGGFPEEALPVLRTARSLAPDSAARAVVAAVERAVHDGCYRAAGPAPSACDPLGPTFQLEGAAQNASALQNATARPPETPPAEAGGTL